MKIRDKLFLSVGLYGTIAMLLGCVAVGYLFSLKTRFAVVEAVDGTLNAVLEVRRFEKNYIVYRGEENLRELRGYLASLKKGLEEIRDDVASDIGPQSLESLQKGVVEYENLFNALAINHEQQYVIFDELKREMPQLRRKAPDYAAAVADAVGVLERHVLSSSDWESLKRHLAVIRAAKEPEFQEFRRRVEQLYFLNQREEKTVELLRAEARQLITILEATVAAERERISRAITAASLLLLFSFLTFMVLGTWANSRLARRIAEPLVRLERVTKQIAAGDFSEQVAVQGYDEVASLSRSFNQMEEQLRKALLSLEETITQLREKQMQLVEAEKLASVGILASGIAHEISNPLTSVLTFSNLMLEKCPADHPDHGRLELMVRETTRARTIVRQLLSFSKEIPIATVPMSINRPIQEVLSSMTEQGVFNGIELKTELDDTLPDVAIDANQVAQVFSNMLINATHAIAPPGVISVVTQRNGECIEVLIADTGAGIPEEHIKKIFDPFFTTKGTRGTGLGLAVSYGIIKKHGGGIDVMSEPGKGTTFTVRLPIHGEIQGDCRR